MSKCKTDIKALNAKICKSGKEFNDVLIKAIGIAGEGTDEICRGATFGLHKALIEASPKDTRRAAAGFSVSVEPSD